MRGSSMTFCGYVSLHCVTSALYLLDSSLCQKGHGRLRAIGRRWRGALGSLGENTLFICQVKSWSRLRAGYERDSRTYISRVRLRPGPGVERCVLRCEDKKTKNCITMFTDETVNKRFTDESDSYSCSFQNTPRLIPSSVLPI